VTRCTRASGSTIAASTFRRTARGSASEGETIGERAIDSEHRTAAASGTEMRDLGERQRHECHRRRAVRRSFERPDERAQRDERDHRTEPEHACKETARQDGLLRTLRRPAHHVGVARFECQRQRGKSVGHQVEPEKLQRRERKWQRGQAGNEQYEDFGDVAAEEVEDELADVVEDDATFFDGRGDGLEPVVLQHDRRGLFGDVGAADPHRDANVGLLQGRRIVRPVAEHRDNFST
jgi:hypothetical protein